MKGNKSKKQDKEAKIINQATHFRHAQVRFIRMMTAVDANPTTSNILDYVYAYDDMQKEAERLKSLINK